MNTMNYSHSIHRIAAAIAAMACLTDTAMAGALTVTVEGLTSDDGQAVVVLMDSELSHTGEAPIFTKQSLPISDGVAELVMEGLPPGDYSAVAYHDVDGNGRLDRHFFGLPKEPYGFSNDARGRFGIPDFMASRFVVGMERVAIQIHVK